MPHEFDRIRAIPLLIAEFRRLANEKPRPQTLVLRRQTGTSAFIVPGIDAIQFHFEAVVVVVDGLRRLEL